MAFEDYTGYTEVDENSDLTVETNKITVSTIRRDAHSYIRDNKGIGHFTNFEHLLKFKYTYVDTTGRMSLWAISNIYNVFQDRNVNNEGKEVGVYGTSGLDYVQLREEELANFDSWNGVAINTSYWLKVKRDGTTLTCKIYSDEYITLVTTLSVVCNTTAYKYIFGMTSYDSISYPDNEISGEIENLDLQEAPPPSGGSMQPIKCWGGV